MVYRGCNISEEHDKITIIYLWLHVQFIGLNIVNTQIFLETLTKISFNVFFNNYTSKEQVEKVNILLYRFSHLSGLIVSQILATLKTQV